LAAAQLVALLAHGAEHVVTDGEQPPAVGIAIAAIR